MMKLSLLGSGLLLTALLLNGCGPSAAPDKAGESVFRYGTTAYGVAMENAGMDPHESYKGWSTLRYGVGKRCSALMKQCSRSPGWQQATNFLMIILLKSLYATT